MSYSNPQNLNPRAFFEKLQVRYPGPSSTSVAYCQASRRDLQARTSALHSCTSYTPVQNLLLVFLGGSAPQTPRILGAPPPRPPKSRPLASRGHVTIHYCIPWYSMGFHGIPGYVVFHGILWYSMVFHGIPWYSMVFHGIPWYSMVYHGIPWYTMVFHGIPWYTMVYHGIPWYTMVYHGIPWYTMVYHGIPWYTMVYHGIPWYTIVYHGIPWYTMANHGIPWYTTTQKPELSFALSLAILLRTSYATQNYHLIHSGNRSER